MGGSGVMDGIRVGPRRMGIGMEGVMGEGKGETGAITNEMGMRQALHVMTRVDNEMVIEAIGTGTTSGKERTRGQDETTRWSQDVIEATLLPLGLIIKVRSATTAVEKTDTRANLTVAMTDIRTEDATTMKGSSSSNIAARPHPVEMTSITILEDPIGIEMIERSGTVVIVIESIAVGKTIDDEKRIGHETGTVHEGSADVSKMSLQ